MNAQPVYVGIDVSKHFLDVAVYPSQEFWRVSNAEPGYQQLVERLRACPVVCIVVEASGGYEQRLVEALVAAQLPVSRVSPARVRKFAQSRGQLAKTDRLDAAMLALYGAKTEDGLRPVVLPHETQRCLSALLQRREQLLEMVTAEENRLENAPAVIQPSIQAVVSVLKDQLQAVMDEINDLISHLPPDLQARYQRLSAQPGVGKILACKLLADVPELGRCSRKQIAALVGVAPFANESGSKRKRRVTKGGRADVRKVLYMTTLSAIRHHPAIRAMYQRLLQAGKEKKVALVACMRKFLTILNAIARSGTPQPALVP